MSFLKLELGMKERTVDFEVIGADLDDPNTVAALIQAIKDARDKLLEE